MKRSFGSFRIYLSVIKMEETELLSTRRSIADRLPLKKKLKYGIPLILLGILLWYFIIQIGGEKWHLIKYHYEYVSKITYSHNIKKEDCILTTKEIDCNDIIFNGNPSPINIIGKCCSTYDITIPTQCILCNYTYINSTNAEFFLSAKGSDFDIHDDVFMRTEKTTCVGNLIQRTECFNEYKKNINLQQVYCADTNGVVGTTCSYEGIRKWFYICLLILLLFICSTCSCCFGYLFIRQDNYIKDYQEGVAIVIC